MPLTSGAIRNLEEWVPPMSEGSSQKVDQALLDILAARRGGVPPTSGGQPPDNTDRRLDALEKNFEKLDGKIDRLTELVRSFGEKSADRLSNIDGRLTGIEKTLDAKASTADVRELSGKVSNIPTTWQTVAIIAALLVGIGGLSFTISRLAEPARQAAAGAQESNPAVTLVPPGKAP